ncbi:ATP-binding protein [Pseudalkalibacillus berkeleyi]|uniref:ATP-binding protein n=1 Tax=Pseudalkalibacillus berkeleyi TaxID=1069813 RepID=A0ABS9H0W2_9BACL|nr:ATP-binding protein [Pseudalkalibacillus berkeleyi]MCF6137478.1 ATP-binding protein [Pseudalkalibacillus berkeleyi]
MRNAIVEHLSNDDYLIITNDNSGGIGEKEQDFINVSYDLLSYYAYRVAVVECMATRGVPKSILLHNYCGEEHWDKLVSGVKTGLSEIGLDYVPINGSSESNYHLKQSAIGLVLIARSKAPNIRIPSLEPDYQFAVIGEPLVGQEVTEYKEQIAPLSVIQTISTLEKVYMWPVGSKGILTELNQMIGSDVKQIESKLDLLKSAGPSTCVIIAYPSRHTKEIKKLSKDLFYPLNIS